MSEDDDAVDLVVDDEDDEEEGPLAATVGADFGEDLVDEFDVERAEESVDGASEADEEDILFDTGSSVSAHPEGMIANPGPRFQEEASDEWSGSELPLEEMVGEFDGDLAPVDPAAEEVQEIDVEDPAHDGMADDEEFGDEALAEDQVYVEGLDDDEYGDDLIEPLDDDYLGDDEGLEELEVGHEVVADTGATLEDVEAAPAAEELGADEFETVDPSDPVPEFSVVDSGTAVPNESVTAGFLDDLGDGEEAPEEPDEAMPSYELRDPTAQPTDEAALDEDDEPVELEEMAVDGASSGPVYYHQQSSGEDPEDWYEDVEPPSDHGLSDNEIDEAYAPVDVEADETGYEDDGIYEQEAAAEGATFEEDEGAAATEFEDPDFSEYEESYVESTGASEGGLRVIGGPQMRRSLLRAAAGLAAAVLLGAGVTLVLFPEVFGMKPPRPEVDMIAIARPESGIDIAAPLVVAALVDPAPNGGEDTSAGSDPTEPSDPEANPEPGQLALGAVEPEIPEPEMPGQPSAGDPDVVTPSDPGEVAVGEQQPISEPDTEPQPHAGDPETATETETQPETLVAGVALGPGLDPSAGDPDIFQRPDTPQPERVEEEAVEMLSGLRVGRRQEAEELDVPDEYRSLKPGTLAFAQLPNEAFFVGKVRRIEATQVSLRLKEGGEVVFRYADLRRLIPVANAELSEVTVANRGYVLLQNNNKLTGSILAQSNEDTVVLKQGSTRIVLPREQVSEFGRLVSGGVKIPPQDAGDDWLRQRAEQLLRDQRRPSAPSGR